MIHRIKPRAAGCTRARPPGRAATSVTVIKIARRQKQTKFTQPPETASGRLRITVPCDFPKQECAFPSATLRPQERPLMADQASPSRAPAQGGRWNPPRAQCKSHPQHRQRHCRAAKNSVQGHAGWSIRASAQFWDADLSPASFWCWSSASTAAP